MTFKFINYYSFLSYWLAALIAACKEYHNRIYKLNEEKWDLELVVCLKEYEIQDLQSRVNDMRGKL